MFGTASQSVTISNMLLAVVFMLGCVALAVPVSNSASNKHDLNHLMTLLGKLKDTQRVRHDHVMQGAVGASSNRHRGNNNITPREEAALLSKEAAAMLLSRDAADSLDAADVYDFETDDDDDDNASSPSSSSSSSSSTMNKRQGAWSFDYGLGGGRFGKRGGYNMYPEYGLGGGRFGRDVKHVAAAANHEDALLKEEEKEKSAAAVL